MKKISKKLSNKGFVLAETIIVTVFMVTIFSALYSNYYPIMANYEKREFYDDIDSKYVAFWIKYMIQDQSYTGDLPHCDTNPSDYKFFDCDNINNDIKKRTCKKLVEKAGLTGENGNPYRVHGIPSIPDGQLRNVGLITCYQISEFRDTNLIENAPLYDSSSGLSDGFIDYINLLPSYSKLSNNFNGSNYRLILELYDNNEPSRAPIYKYVTIEVKK